MLRGSKFFLKFLSTLIVLGVLVGAPGGGLVWATPDESAAYKRGDQRVSYQGAWRGNR